MGVDRAGDSAMERIFFEPYGMPHKRIGDHAIPPFMQASALAALKETWKPRKDSTFLVMPPGCIAPDMNAIGLLVGLAEQWSPDMIKPFDMSWTGVISYLVKKFVTGDMFQLQLPTHPLADRAIEWRVGCGQEAADHRCFITKLPPSLMPASTLQGSGRSDERLADAEDESDCSAPEGGEKVVVICADPRYLVMKEYMMLKKLHDLYKRKMGRTETLEVARFLELGINGPTIRSLKRFAEWAREEQRHPSQVKMFFIEEFVSEPDMALLGLARFLGMQSGSNVLQKVAQEMQALVQQSRGLFTSCPEGVSELQFMRGLVQQFESHLAAVPPGVAEIWAEQISELMQIQNPVVLSLGRVLQSHLQLQLPAWLAAHRTGLCRPCTFAPRGLCRNAEACSFCHGPHRVNKRPSKKERERRDRQRQRAMRFRTPSPAGLSS